MNTTKEMGCREKDGKYYFLVEAASVNLYNRKLPSKVVMSLVSFLFDQLLLFTDSNASKE